MTSKLKQVKPEIKKLADDTERTKTEHIDFFYGALLAVSGALWYHFVSRDVDKPYLDEYFHVRQALVYAEDKWTTWDPKITTPPGLYVLSYPLMKVLGSDSAVHKLRVINNLALFPLWLVLNTLVREVRNYKRQQSTASKAKESDEQLDSSVSSHIALNISLFPPLFFFCALYYTDVVSAILVLKAHTAFHTRQPLWVVVWSLASLSFRQTNIFWTAVYLAALEVKRHLTSRNPTKKIVGTTKGKNAMTEKPKSLTSVLEESWKTGTIYDPEWKQSTVIDLVLTGISLAIASLSNLASIVFPLAPHVSVLGAFAAFVAWNGGVVLGDKSNHVATLHVPQMLYIWPYICFFSLPIIATCIVSTFSRGPLPIPNLITAVALTAIALFFIATNTIVHPFMLADNRHYTFYIFRILLRQPAYKFLAAPVYILCGWASIFTMDGSMTDTLIWLSVTTLSLITAPLVEPRYFILPWIMWRVQAGDMSSLLKSQKTKQVASSNSMIRQVIKVLEDNVLYLETLWLLCINMVVCYIFIHWKFEWPQEPGETMRFMW